MRPWCLLVLAGCGRFGFDSAPLTGADAGEDAAVDAFVDRPNRIFMTSTTVTGNLGGFAGADATCQAAADAATLGGRWLAVLWSLTADPGSRFAGSRGWVALDGTVIADQPDSLTHAINPLHIDELGQDTGIVRALWGGQPIASITCSEWTSTVTGQNGLHVVSAHASWDTDEYGQCANPARLICAEIGHVAEVAPPVETGRVAFISATNFLPGGGLAAADAHCQNDATAAGLPGTFLAFVATASRTAESRFAAGLPWRRVDGVRITQTAAEMLDPLVPVWKSFIGRTATGQLESARAWTGTPNQNCASWTSNTNQQVASIGNTHSAERVKLQLFPGITCNNGFRLICLEQ